MIVVCESRTAPWIVKSDFEKNDRTGMATNKLPHHFGYRKEVGEILKTALDKFERTGIMITNSATAFATSKKFQ